jgi:hypothetical protein
MAKSHTQIPDMLRPVTNAVCELGIPPLPQSLVTSHRPWFAKCRKNLASWAVEKPKKADNNGTLQKRATSQNLCPAAGAWTSGAGDPTASSDVSRISLIAI